MKLKTLKDLEIAGHDIVREEAIKWVKEENKKWREALSQEGLACPYGNNPSTYIFKKFHNITEEDLK